MDILSTALNYFVVVVLLILTVSLIKILRKESKEAKNVKKECCGGKGNNYCSGDNKKECSCQSEKNERSSL